MKSMTETLAGQEKIPSRVKKGWRQPLFRAQSTSRPARSLPRHGALDQGIDAWDRHERAQWT